MDLSTIVTTTLFIKVQSLNNELKPLIIFGTFSKKKNRNKNQKVRRELQNGN